MKSACSRVLSRLRSFVGFFSFCASDGVPILGSGLSVRLIPFFFHVSCDQSCLGAIYFAYGWCHNGQTYSAILFQLLCVMSVWVAVGLVPCS